MAEPPTQALTAVAATEPDDGTSRKGGYVALIVGVVLALALLGVGAWALLGGETNTVAVPNVVGQSLKKATATIEGEGFVLGTVDAQTSDEKQNTVLSQSPLGDEQAEEGSAIDLVISKGPEQVEVPELEGFLESEAIQRIRDAQLVYAGSEDVPSDQPAGTVVGSDPAQGTVVDIGSDVTLQVSNGEVEVPDVVGDTESEARAKLAAAGFNVTVVYEQTDAEDPGVVLEQSPAAGDTARLATTVLLTVAEAPPEPTPSDTPSPSPSDTKTNSGQGN